MNLRHHILGVSALLAAGAILFGLPLVSADVQRDTPAPLTAWLPDASGQNTLLLFAGFPGCQGACPTTLRQLATLKSRADEQFDSSRLSVVFLNLHLDTGRAGATAYAQSFHPAFAGIAASDTSAPELQRLIAQTGSNALSDLLRHRTNVYLYRPIDGQWTLARVFLTLPDAATLLDDLAPVPAETYP